MDSGAPRAPSKDVVPEPAAPRRRGERARTIPEQIADQLAAAIVNREYRDGERIREQELAEMYGVSRGPVREAIRALEKHGLVMLYPRRGAYVVGVSLDVIVDAFNIRAALAGVAARYFTRRQPPDGLMDLEKRVAEAVAMAGVPDTNPIAYAEALANCGRAIYRSCGAGHLQRMLRDQFYSSIWGLIWRIRPLDYHTVERRLSAAEDWRQILQAALAGDECTAERMFRKNLFDSRDGAIATLSENRNETADPALLFRD
jgi:DNA-binding GntR family transcriptional regulator